MSPNMELIDNCLMDRGAYVGCQDMGLTATSPVIIALWDWAWVGLDAVDVADEHEVADRVAAAILVANLGVEAV